MFLFFKIFKDAICAPDQCDRRCYQCDPVLRTIYRSGAKCISDPFSGSHEVPVFLIFILVLQQFDGNILGPKILGDSTGLPSFWVLFSILLFGGLFGFVGMIIAVPTFAVIYRAMSLYINSALKKKNYSENTPDYCRLHHIDPRSGDFIDMDQWPEAGNKGMNDLDMAAGEELEEKTENIEK